MSAGEQSNDSSKLSLTTNNGSSTFATVVKELATNINYLSLNNEPPTTNEQAEAVHKVWLSKSERITIENSWNRATKVSCFSLSNFFTVNQNERNRKNLSINITFKLSFEK